jgi:excisionase family DNA binding protein
MKTKGDYKKIKDLTNRIQFRPEEVADVLGVSVSKVKQWIKTEALHSYLIDGMRFVHKNDVSTFIESYRNQSVVLAS